MGTPSKLTEDKIDIVRKAMESGLSRESLAAKLGVHESTARRWYYTGQREAKRRQRGRDADPSLDLHVLFFEAWDAGMGELEETAVGIIKAAAKNGVWQAAAWLLERRFPETWSNVAKQLTELIQEYLDERRRERRNNPHFGRGD